MPAPRDVVVLVYDGCQPIDAVGPTEVLVGADLMRPGSYSVTIASPSGGPVRCGPAVSLGSVAVGRIERDPDTLIVVGGWGADAASRDRAVLDAIARLAPRCRRVASVCSGALILAACGLLDGRRATTHWAEADRLASLHPDVRVESDPIFVRDGKYWTSAGVTAGLDLALALVVDDLGDDVARSIAQWLVMYAQRPGGQSQFSAYLTTPTAATPPVRDIQDWIPDHLAEDLSVAALARRAAMSTRHFARRFRDELGVTPAAHVTALRVERAKALLVEGTSTNDVVTRCGFGTHESFIRAFKRTAGITPDRYRQHFSITP